MPLGFERLNERTQRPNALINFIRPLPGPMSSAAESILNRVAAICYPFMKKHTVLVQALEEFPHNNEFVGRNFNAGEVIQLVLRNRQGQWLPERWVMMVMVHELAHCKQMNHSKSFWKVRDEYAKDLRELWTKGYTGEGLWGRGRDLETGEMLYGSVALGDVPEHLCGGAYQRKRRKRKRAKKEREELTYKEKQERRILKKFGKGGLALGADENAKVKLEGGAAKKGKPRVAGSARGRDLRAAAALARFGAATKDDVPIKTEENESESDDNDGYEATESEGAAIDVDGKKMVDNEGHALVKICGDEDARDEEAERELEEIQDMLQPSKQRPAQPLTPHPGGTSVLPERETFQAHPVPKQEPPADILHLDKTCKLRSDLRRPRSIGEEPQNVPMQLNPCPICSLDNELGAAICEACSNVLHPHLIQGHWQCQSESCKFSDYINASDMGRCGLCGAPKGHEN